MDLGTKILLIIAFLILDLFSVFVPITAIAIVAIIIAKPAWFKQFVDELYSKQ